MARERPDASDSQQPTLTCFDGGRPDDDGADGTRLTRAEARALHRSAPLTHAQLMQHLEGVSDSDAPLVERPPEDQAQAPSRPAEGG